MPAAAAHAAAAAKRRAWAANRAGRNVRTAESLVARRARSRASIACASTVGASPIGVRACSTAVRTTAAESLASPGAFDHASICALSAAPDSRERNRSQTASSAASGGAACARPRIVQRVVAHMTSDRQRPKTHYITWRTPARQGACASAPFSPRPRRCGDRAGRPGHAVGPSCRQTS